MRRRFVLILMASAVAAAPALAGSPYQDGASPDRTGRMGGLAAPPARRGPAGLFNCSFREQRTKLERKNCGTIRS